MKERLGVCKWKSNDKVRTRCNRHDSSTQCDKTG